MDIKEELLIQEFNHSVKRIYHIDELRNKLTTIFLTIAGFGGAGLAILFKNDIKHEYFIYMIKIFLIIIGIIGFLFIFILAKLRKVQIEYMRILNGIRKLIFNKNYAYWNAIQFTDKKIPKPNRQSGTYFWLLVIITVNSFIWTLSFFIFLQNIFINYRLLLTFIFFFILFYFQDRFYFKYAFPPDKEIYSDNNPPF